jgi:hypothetical protein
MSKVAAQLPISNAVIPPNSDRNGPTSTGRTRIRNGLRSTVAGFSVCRIA